MSHDCDGLDGLFTYRWGFDAFRTPKHYGLGIEICPTGRKLVGLRLGSWMISFGQQIVWKNATATTQPDNQQPAHTG